MTVPASTVSHSGRISVGGRCLALAALSAVAWVSFATPGPTAVASTATPDAAPAETAPSDTTPAGTAPPETPPADTAPPTTSPDVSATTEVSTGGTTAREENPSTWWWIGGGVVGVIAVVGIVYGVRRRRTVEDWANEASLMCDIGRAMTATLDEHLRTDPVWSPPERYERQRQRFEDALGDLVATAPDDDFATLLAAAQHASTRLGDSVDALVPLQPNDAARATLQPALDDVATALSAVENEASITVFGTALPSSRPSA